MIGNFVHQTRMNDSPNPEQTADSIDFSSSELAQQC